MSIANEIRAGLRELRTELDSPTLEINSVTVPCIVSTIRRGTIVAVGGFEQVVGCTFLVESDDWTTTGLASGKATGSTCTHGGKTYRLLTVKLAPGGSHYEIDAIDPQR